MHHTLARFLILPLSTLLISCGGSDDTAPASSSLVSSAFSFAARSSVAVSSVSSATVASVTVSSAGVSSAATAALDSDTAIFVRETTGGDQIVAIDVTTKATRVIQDFSAGGGATVSHVALSPDRSMIAFGAHYQLSAADLAQGIPSEAIWTMKADGTAMQKLQSGFPAASPGFTQTCNADPVCQAISAQSICGASGYCQLAGQTNALDDLAWSPDGAAIWFTITQMSATAGGSSIGWIPASGGSSTLLTQFCQLMSDPLPVADGTVYFRAGLCSGSTSDMLAAVTDKGAANATPILSADNVGGTYAGGLGTFGIKATASGAILFSLTHGDFDGDGDTGDAIGEYDPTQAALSALPDVTASLVGFAPSPDETRLIACFNDDTNALAYNLYLFDMAQQSWEALSSDGKSCEPAW